MKDYSKLNRILKIIGCIFLCVGFVISIIAFIDFFTSSSPTKFYFFFIGFPLMFVGFSSLMIGFSKEISRYSASQTAPVAKDVTNYMLHNTQDELSKTIHKANNLVLICPKCKEENTQNAMFCKKCGAKLSVKCSHCGAENSVDSTFCSSCGNKL